MLDPFERRASKAARWKNYTTSETLSDRGGQFQFVALQPPHPTARWLMIQDGAELVHVLIEHLIDLTHRICVIAGTRLFGVRGRSEMAKRLQ